MRITIIEASLAAALAVLCIGVAPVAAEDVAQPGPEKVVVDPPVGHIGTRFDISCANFPEPTRNDSVYIVRKGAPDVDPLAVPAPKEKVLFKGYASNCWKDGMLGTAGPFAPGEYEARFATTLYNNDGRVEIAARTAFTVAR